MGTVKYSGPIASFHCPTEATIRSLKVHFSPKQLGSGTPSPENIRPIEGWDGVEVEQSQNNLLNGQWLAEKIAAAGGTIDNIAKTIVYSGSVANSAGIILDKFNYGRYTIIAKFTSTNSNPNLNIRVCYSDNGELLLSTSNGIEIGTNIYKFTTAINKQISNIKCSWIAGTTTLYYDMFGIYEGDINNFEPYHGSTTNYEFGVLGKNKFDYASTTFIQGIRGNDGEFISDNVSHYTEQFISVIPATEYTLSGNNLYSGGYVVRIYYSDADKNWISKTAGDRTNALTFTTPSNCYYIQIQTNSNNTNPDTWQLELGSTATAYEPYDPNKTVYGGWVDLVSGEVCEEWKPFDLTTLTLTQFGVGESVLTISAFPGAIKSRNAMYCNFLPPVSNPNISGVEGVDWNNSRMNMCLSVNRGLDTQAKVEQWLTDMKTGGTTPMIVADMVTPNIYHLAPTQLHTFLSQNNIWSNADYVEVEYDLHETQNILARKQFIIANQPHIEMPAAAPLQNFVTDIKAPLKECKVYFEPKQDLHGYDKPWVGGTGKNLFNINATEQNPDDTTATNTTARNFTAGTYCVGTSWSNWLQPNQVLEYSVSNGVLSIKNNNVYGVGYALKVEPETNYAISATSSGGGIHAAFYDASGNFINGLSTNLLNTSFTTPADATITVLTFYNRSEGSDATAATFSNIQFEKSASVTSYEPWKNICPISGWNEINIYKTGKNLLDISSPKSAINNGEVWYGIKAVTPASERVPDNSIYLPSGTYCFSLNDSVHCNELLMQDDNNNKFIHKYNARSAQGTIDYGAYCFLYASASKTNIPDISKAQFYLEYGNTDTGYEPYNGTTIPISFPSVINMLSSTIITANKTLSSAGEEISESGMSLTNYIKVNEDDTYKLTFTSKEGARTRRIYGYDANKDPVESLASTSWVTVDTTGTIQATIPSGIEYIRVCYKTADENIFLEGPESSVIYGGYVDLVKGEIIKNWNFYTITGEETFYQSGDWVSIFVPSEMQASNDVSLRMAGFCSHYPYRAYARGKIGVMYNERTVTLDGNIYDAAGWKAYCQQQYSNGTPITLCYPLRTPIHYPIDPQTLKTLRGTNNIWSDANGNIELSYWKH